MRLHPLRGTRQPHVLTAIIALSSAMLSGCGSSGGTTTTTQNDELAVSIVEGNGQTAVVRGSVPVKPAVKVTSHGVAAPGIGVTFVLTTGNSGGITGAIQTTGTDGIARLGDWTLGNTAGPNTVTASVIGAAGSPVTFTATGTAGPGVLLSKVAGDAQSAAAGTGLATRPSVRVNDAFGNLVAGQQVTFAATAGGGTVTGGTQTTGVDGLATLGAWILGQLSGANTLTVTAPGLTGSGLTFTATGVAGPLAAMTKVAGDNQSALVSMALITPPAVRLADQFGNLIANQAVTFAVASGGGAATGTSQTSGANGVATVGGWTLGAAAGPNTMTASASSFTVTFNATGTAAGFNAQPYAGTYTGTWTNTTFGSTGTANAVVTVNAAANTATVTVNVTGSVLGTGGGVSNVAKTGNYTATGFTFGGNIPPMGDLTATGVVNANDIGITASGINIPNPSISRWNATGTLTASALQLNFTVTFTTGSPAAGTISLTKP